MEFPSKAREEIDELEGSLAKKDKGLMHSVQEAKEKIKDGKLVKEAINRGFGSFVPDMFFEKLVNNYQLTEKLYGKTFVNLVSGYEGDYVGKNIQIPEFQRELEKKILEKAKQLQKKGLLDKEQRFTDKAVDMAAISLYTEELNKLLPPGIQGTDITKRRSNTGTKEDTKQYKKGDRYNSIALRGSIKKAIRRKHKELQVEDLSVYEYAEHSRIFVIYALDSSGSMQAEKIDMAKKAGVALAYKAIQQQDKVGLVVFNNEVRDYTEPTDDFNHIVKSLVKAKPSQQTNLIAAIDKAIQLFPNLPGTKHLLLLTDAIPTKGTNEEVLEAVAKAKGTNVTISLIGINLDKKGEKLAKKITEIGEGNLFTVKNLTELDSVVLEDYYSVN